MAMRRRRRICCQMPMALPHYSSSAASYPNAKLLLALLDNGTYVGTFRQNTTIPVTLVDLGSGRGPIEMAQFQRPPVPAAESRYAMDLPGRLAAASFRYDVHPVPARQHIVDAGFLQQSDVASRASTRNQGGTSEQFGGNWIHVFSPRLLNEFRVSETRTRLSFGYTPETDANPLAKTASVTFNQQSEGGFPSLGARAIAVSAGQLPRTFISFRTRSPSPRADRRCVSARTSGEALLTDNVPFNYYGSLHVFNQGGAHSPTSVISSITTLDLRARRPSTSAALASIRMRSTRPTSRRTI